MQYMFLKKLREAKISRLIFFYFIPIHSVVLNFPVSFREITVGHNIQNFSKIKNYTYIVKAKSKMKRIQNQKNGLK